MALADSALFTILTSLENLLACSIEASRIVNSQKPPLTSSGAVKIASRNKTKYTVRDSSNENRFS